MVNISAHTGSDKIQPQDNTDGNFPINSNNDAADGSNNVIFLL